MKRKQKKKGLHISVYFTVVIMAVVVATLLVSAGVTQLLDWLFAIHVSFPTPALLLLFSLLLGCTEEMAIQTTGNNKRISRETMTAYLMIERMVFFFFMAYRRFSIFLIFLFISERIYL